MSEAIDIKELKDEAKFLKACGTLLETPVEIHKVSRKRLDTDAHKEELNPLMTCASIEKLKLKDPLDESSTPVKTCGKWVTGEGFLKLYNDKTEVSAQDTLSIGRRFLR
ncbi:protein JASON-like [Salvia miltiorrhiza]|uniref:protein JASON-like n=1 Tax=Salvia miltiorrhiza TaxID=226208 RepID=UPI0025ABF47A|nr:protein JASON-like [Salvia miltiorrhiza]